MSSFTTASRVKANKELLEMIEKAMEKYPDMRFHQLLDFLGILKEHPVHKPCMTNEFYTEPSDVVKRVRASGRI